MSKISEFCRSIVPAFIEEQVCNFPEWAADKLYAPIERKIEAKINQIQKDVYYKITHNAEFEAEESGKDWITYFGFCKNRPISEAWDVTYFGLGKSKLRKSIWRG